MLISSLSVRLLKTSIRGCRGFTLVELVAVIVLIGILSVAVSSVFSKRDDFSAYALRDELISAYRIAQQRAMYEHGGGTCYSLSITNAGFEPQRDGVFFGDKGQVAFAGDYAGLSVSPAPTTIYFDGLGNHTAVCGSTIVSGTTSLMIGSVGVDIYPTGYIKAQ